MAERTLARGRMRSFRPTAWRRIRRTLLACGICYGAAYILADDVVAAGMWEHYSRLDQAISELSGTGAPSAGFLTLMNPVFTALVVAFGAGVWSAAASSRALRATAVLLVLQGLLFPVWLLYPMTSRGDLAHAAGGANDLGHLVLTVVAVGAMVAQMILSGVALGRPFRAFAVAMAVVLLAAGAYVGTTVGTVAQGGETPWMGLVERASYGAWLLWMAGLAAGLLRRSGRTGLAPAGAAR
ncbi:MAG: DUF998 domain-containing protein [Pseudonocardia sp.]|uniref:DUF998 domain-containing protein n=1 Tax=unclassified Pseudonocardia TaxID=2619320 RepID=UPI001ACDAD32|nr:MULTISPECIES: DUF998 domain-containing protein [unclassified Pseudonocardia]MBN9110817.1 DUF998 domain-containing protein [Pseudonocardia sp.]